MDGLNGCSRGFIKTWKSRPAVEWDVAQTFHRLSSAYVGTIHTYVGTILNFRDANVQDKPESVKSCTWVFGGFKK